MIRVLPLILALGLVGGCLLPKGTPVYVDGRHGKLWSGKGVLLETNEDESWCKVAARNRALAVETMWVECAAVHRRFPDE